MRELQALVAPKPLQGVLVRGHAGLVINKLTPDSCGGEVLALRRKPEEEEVARGGIFPKKCAGCGAEYGRAAWGEVHLLLLLLSITLKPGVESYKSL